MPALPQMPEEGDIHALVPHLAEKEAALVSQAWEVAHQAHAGQMRQDGSPYITHPVAVAEIVASWRLDGVTIAAALLHDVVEDTEVGLASLRERFGGAVAGIVDGVSKLERIPFSSREQEQAENFRKMLLAMAKDVRVMLVKLADRLHNMRTLDAKVNEARQRIARETLEVYAPIAHRLGLVVVAHELEDLAFMHLYPNRYAVLARAVKAVRGNRKEVVGKIKAQIEECLRQQGIEAEVSGREKNLYGIYRKMQDKGIAFSEVLDIYAFRVIVADTPHCYLALGALHGLYRPMPGKFKDYIALPKPNGYQSLHSTLLVPFGMPIEVQVRSREMHRQVETGVASHWIYKAGEPLRPSEQKNFAWLQDLLQIQSESGDALEFLEHVKVDLFPEEVYVFSPKGAIIALPRGATVVDYAYAIHTEIGHHCIAAKINQELAPLRTELATGDQIEIITSEHAHPNPAWLRFVKTGRARAAIRHFLRSIRQEESVALGERLFLRALESVEISMKDVGQEAWDNLLLELGLPSREALFADIGLGMRLAQVVAHQVAVFSGKEWGAARNPGPVVLRGTEGLAVHFAPCCHPIPGDRALGYIHKTKGLVVHTRDCAAVFWKKKTESAREWLDVTWDQGVLRLFEAKIRVLVPNKPGELAKIAAAVADAFANIVNTGIEAVDAGNVSCIELVVQVKHRVHLARVMRRIRRIREVIRLERIQG